MDRSKQSKREYLILRACWDNWRKPVDVADEIGECRKLIAKDMAALCREEFLLREAIDGAGHGVVYRTVRTLQTID